jgi:hypothetical protein
MGRLHYVLTHDRPVHRTCHIHTYEAAIFAAQCSMLTFIISWLYSEVPE